MIHKPQLSLKQTQNNIIILFLYYYTLSYLCLWSYMYYLNALLWAFNWCVVLLFWRKKCTWNMKKHEVSFLEISANGCFCIKVSYLCSTTVMYVLRYERHSICDVVFSLTFTFCVTTRRHMWKKLFGLCFGGALRTELLYKRSHTWLLSQRALPIHTLHVSICFHSLNNICLFPKFPLL